MLADVAGGFGQRARELLDRSNSGPARADRSRRACPVVFLVRCRICASVSISSLRSCSLQARDRAVELGEVELDRAHLLLEARAEDADFAGVVQQLVEQVGVDARQFAAARVGAPARDPAAPGAPAPRRNRAASRQLGLRRSLRAVGMTGHDAPSARDVALGSASSARAVRGVRTTRLRRLLPSARRRIAASTVAGAGVRHLDDGFDACAGACAARHEYARAARPAPESAGRCSRVIRACAAVRRASAAALRWRRRRRAPCPFRWRPGTIRVRGSGRPWRGCPPCAHRPSACAAGASAR